MWWKWRKFHKNLWHYFVELLNRLGMYRLRNSWVKDKRYKIIAQKYLGKRQLDTTTCRLKDAIKWISIARSNSVSSTGVLRENENTEVPLTLVGCISLLLHGYSDLVRVFSWSVLSQFCALFLNSTCTRKCCYVNQNYKQIKLKVLKWKFIFFVCLTSMRDAAS